MAQIAQLLKQEGGVVGGASSWLESEAHGCRGSGPNHIMSLSVLAFFGYVTALGRTLRCKVCL